MSGAPESNRAGGLRIETPDLGGRRGRLSDRVTQRWVQHTGRRVRWDESPWLAAPVGDVDGIGPDFFERFAARHGLKISRGDHERGLLDRFADLEGPDCRVAAVHQKSRVSTSAPRPTVSRCGRSGAECTGRSVICSR